MRISDSEARKLLRDWKEKKMENPDGDSYVILRRIIRMRVSEPKDQQDVCDQISELYIAERRASWAGQKVIAITSIHRGITQQHSGKDLAAGAETEDRRDRMHDMMLEG